VVGSDTRVEGRTRSVSDAPLRVSRQALVDRCLPAEEGTGHARLEHCGFVRGPGVGVDAAT
jgi:hypothetical protein